MTTNSAPVTACEKESLLQKQLYAGLLEILNERRYYYCLHAMSMNGLSEAGKEATIRWVETLAHEMRFLSEKKLEEQSKAMVWNELKQ